MSVLRLMLRRVSQVCCCIMYMGTEQSRSDGCRHREILWTCYLVYFLLLLLAYCFLPCWRAACTSYRSELTNQSASFSYPKKEDACRRDHFQFIFKLAIPWIGSMQLRDVLQLIKSMINLLLRKKHLLVHWIDRYTLRSRSRISRNTGCLSFTQLRYFLDFIRNSRLHGNPNTYT